MIQLQISTTDNANGVPITYFTNGSVSIHIHLLQTKICCCKASIAQAQKLLLTEILLHSFLFSDQFLKTKKRLM